MPAFQPTGILCAGNYVYDVLVRPVDKFDFNATTWVERIEPHTGGNGANTGFALGMMGARVRVLGAVGRDDFGDFVLARLRQGGVDVSHLARLDAQTATTVVLVRSDGERAFLHQPGVSRIVFRDGLDFTPELCAGFSHFHLANVFAMPGMRAHAPDVLLGAERAGLSVSLDTGWDSRAEWLPVFAAGLPAVDLMFVNEEESRMLTGSAVPEQAARFLQARGVATVVVKLGGRGCLIFAGAAAPLPVPGFAVDAIDTTGAGDTFAGGFLAALGRGMDLFHAARHANAVGALNVQQLGATAGIRTWDETVAWMSGR